MFHCALVLLMVLVFFKFAKRHGYSHGRCGGRRRGPGDCSGRSGRRRSGRRRGFVEGLFEDLDASPGQEREVKAAASDLEGAAHKFRSDLKSSVRQMSEALRADDFDHEAVAEAWVTQDRALEQLRLSLITSLQSIHAVLDPEQRGRLASKLERRSV